MSSNPLRSVLQRTPLRVTLVVALVLLSAMGLAVTGVVVTTQLRNYLVSQVDKDLAAGLAAAQPAGRPARTTATRPFETSRDEYFGYSATDGSGLTGRDESPPTHIHRAIQPAQLAARGHRPVHGRRPASGGPPLARRGAATGAVLTGRR